MTSLSAKLSEDAGTMREAAEEFMARVGLGRRFGRGSHRGDGGYGGGRATRPAARDV